MHTPLPYPAPAPAPPNAAYTAVELATLLNCSVKHVQSLTRKKVIPGAIRLGRIVRYSRAAVDHWLAGARDSLADSTAERGKTDAV